VDILLEVSQGTRAEDVRDFAMAHCRALDFFLIEGASARSCANGSKVSGTSKRDLTRRLDAVEFWNTKNGFLVADIDWEFETLHGVQIPMTTLISARPFPSKAEAVSTLVSTDAPAPRAFALRDHPLAVAAASAVATALVLAALFESLRVAPLKERLDALSSAETHVTTDSAGRTAAATPDIRASSDSAARPDTSSARR
jgi:hypothetical protein